MQWTLRRLEWSDPSAGSIDLPLRRMDISLSFGSGLARRADDDPGTFWAVGDRGPNIKPKTLVELYGLETMQSLKDRPGTRIMPRLDIGPAIARLRIERDRVELVERRPLTDQAGESISGLPPLTGEDRRCELAFDLAGEPLAPDPSGLDTEGIVALGDGGFWLADELGPSLVRVEASGRVAARYVPHGTRLDGARYPVFDRLPAIAAARQLNRGFEAIALAPEERWLFLAFQSPLAHPDQAAHEKARHVRLWRLDGATLEVEAQHLYPLDPPHAFRRDMAKGRFGQNDVKLSELAYLGDGRLLALERGAETTKLYVVRPSARTALPRRHLDLATRPTVEELSAAGSTGLMALDKELLFSSDDAGELPADMEGMAVLSPHELLLVNDNDFGVEGTATSFWVLAFDEPVLG